MTTFEESHLRFEFDDTFELIASDHNPNIKNIKNALQGTKDVDFFGFVGKDMFFFEVKNFKIGDAQEEAETLTTEVAQKLRDTVAIIVGANRYSANDEAFWKKLYKGLGKTESPIFFVFWLEEEPAHNPRARPRLQVLTEKLKQKCKWLGAKVSIQSIDNQFLEGLKASYLPNNS